MHRNFSEWLDEMEVKIGLVNAQEGYADSSDKNVSLEKLKGIDKEISTQAESFAKFESRIEELPDNVKTLYLPVLRKYAGLKTNVTELIAKLSELTKDHDRYLQQMKSAVSYVTNKRLNLQQFGDLHVEQATIGDKLLELENLVLSLNEGLGTTGVFTSIKIQYS